MTILCHFHGGPLEGECLERQHSSREILVPRLVRRGDPERFEYDTATYTLIATTSFYGRDVCDYDYEKGQT